MCIKTPIHDFLTRYSAENFTRCHMPGHKGINSPHDITEISGADALYSSGGIIAESEKIAAELFGSVGTFYSCAGSTLAIQAMLTLIKQNGGNRISAFRGSHRSLASAAALLDLDVDWYYDTPEIFPDTSAAFMTSIDFYGREYDVEKIAETCRQAGIASGGSPAPLLVDNAHGAYLVLTGEHPLRKGAAMTADSAHKTLPALTGGAYLHVSDRRFSDGAKAAMAIFGSTSPSYLILESLDLCNKHIAECKSSPPEAFEAVAELKRSLEKSGYTLRNSDLPRVTINAREYGYSGFSLADALRGNNIECEYADENCAVLLFSTVTKRADTRAVMNAFTKIKQKKPLGVFIYPEVKPKKIMTLREAVFTQNCAYLSLTEAVGKVCAEILAPCPPCVPVIMPGELITADEAEALKVYNINKIKVTC